MTTSTSTSHTTTDHDEIRTWIEKRSGTPSVVKSAKDGNSGLLRVNFPGFSGEGSLEEISWDDFFRIFEENRLAFLYQEQTADGEESRFHKFVSR